MWVLLRAVGGGGSSAKRSLMLSADNGVAFAVHGESNFLHAKLETTTKGGGAQDMFNGHQLQYQTGSCLVR